MPHSSYDWLLYWLKSYSLNWILVTSSLMEYKLAIKNIHLLQEKKIGSFTCFWSHLIFSYWICTLSICISTTPRWVRHFVRGIPREVLRWPTVSNDILSILFIKSFSLSLSIWTPDFSPSRTTRNKHVKSYSKKKTIKMARSPLSMLMKHWFGG